MVPVVTYSTFIGGSELDTGESIAVDNSGDAYVTGETVSSNFPITSVVYQKSKLSGSSNNIFVTKLNPDGSALLYSTYLGGSVDDEFSRIKVDSSGDAYIAGLTTSPDFPNTTGAFQTHLSGSQDFFVTKLNPAAPV